MEDKKFGVIAWEVLNILKENFPSKIHLQQDNLELCKPCFVEMSQSEELRRQISCLISIKEEERALSQDEFEDVWQTLQFAEKVQDVRSQNLCLELLSTSSTLSSLQTLKQEQDTLKRIVDKNDFSQLSSNRIIAQELLDRVNKVESKSMNNTLQRQFNEIDDALSLNSDTVTGFQTPLSTMERPTSTRMCLFQLAESNDINRVNLILDTLSQRSKETLQQMRKKYQLNTKLISILKKYCNGDYGFDQIASRHGTFQYNLVKLLCMISNEYVVFLECLQNQTIDYLSQIIEEGIIFAYEDSLSGQIVGSSLNLFKFLHLALEFIELTIGRQYKEFIPSIRENLNKIQQRMIKLLQKKENALLNLFIQQYSTNLTSMKSEKMVDEELEIPSSQLDVEQLSELKAVSQGLYEFAVELNQKIQRIEALNDFNEEHEEKHLRLFYKLMTVNNKKTYDTTYQPFREKKGVQFNDNQYLTTFDKQQMKLYENEKRNVFLNNQLDISNEKRLPHEQQKYDFQNKENQTHYIGSPIKPLQRGDHHYYSREQNLK